MVGEAGEGAREGDGLQRDYYWKWNEMRHLHEPGVTTEKRNSEGLCNDLNGLVG